LVERQEATGGWGKLNHEEKNYFYYFQTYRRKIKPRNMNDQALLHERGIEKCKQNFIRNI